MNIAISPIFKKYFNRKVFGSNTWWKIPRPTKHFVHDIAQQESYHETAKNAAQVFRGALAVQQLHSLLAMIFEICLSIKSVYLH